MSRPVYPLPVYPYPLDEAREHLVLQAISSLELAYDLQIVPAVPGSPGRMLCFGAPAPHYSEHVVIAPENVDKFDSIRRAIDFVLNAPPGTKGSFTEEMWLNAVFGGGVNLLYEIRDEDVAWMEPR